MPPRADLWHGYGQDTPRCVGTTADGERCPQDARAGLLWCAEHDRIVRPRAATASAEPASVAEPPPTFAFRQKWKAARRADGEAELLATYPVLRRERHDDGG